MGNIGQFCIVCIYRSPNLTTPMNNILLSSIKDICKTSNKFEMVVVGDFNLPDVSWDIGNVKCPQVITQNELFLQQMQYTYVETFNELGMKWFLTNETT